MNRKHIEIEKPVSVDEFADLLLSAHKSIQHNAVSYVAVLQKEGIEKRRVVVCPTKELLNSVLDEQRNEGYTVAFAFEMHTKQ